MHPMLEKMRSELPEVLCRKQITQFLGGFISAKYLANLDRKNKGPKSFIFGERKVLYYRDDVLEWMDARLTERTPSHGT